jgi:class 3 adenylate cyclase
MSHESPIDDDPAPALVRRLATILAADVAGYSRMMGENEEATVQTMRGHRGVFDALLKQHHGRVFNTAGDMILAEFPSAVEAVRCATEIQAALRTRNEHLPPERRMLFRMGINLGDVVVQEGDLLGDGVNVAARIQTVAEPGGICISSSVYDQIQNKLSLQFKSLGDRSFKNIGQPIRTFSVLSGDGTGALPSAPAVTARTLRIGAAVALLAVAVGAGGYWLYGQNEAKRGEQVALAAQLEAQKQATEEAKRALAAQSLQAADFARKAEEARGAADAAQREAALKAQLQAADEARRRTDAERKRLDDELQKSRAERSAAAGRPEPVAEKASPASPPADPAPQVAAVAPTRASPPRLDRFDGDYDGVMCNQPNNARKRACWPVTLNLRNGVALGSWTQRLLQKPAQIRVTVEGGGTASASLDGWSSVDGTAVVGAMRGTLADNHMDLSGRWSSGMGVDGHWTKKP